MPLHARIGRAGDVAAPQWPAELLMLWFRGQKGPFPLEASQASPRAQRLGVRAGRAVRPSHRVRARARPGAHTPVCKGIKVRGNGIRATDRWGRVVSERKRKEKGATTAGLLGHTVGSA
jgi:hypothetical protein